MAHKVKVPATADMGSQELMEEIIRKHAYQLFEQLSAACERLALAVPSGPA
jgi:hypothetical protein